MSNGVSLRIRAAVARGVVIAGLALSLAGCSQTSGLLLSETAERDIEPSRVAEMSPSEAQKAAEHWGKEHGKKSKDGKAAINYARSLKALGRKQEALGVLQSSYLYNAQDREYLSEMGRLALDQGHAPMAQQLLEKADDPAKPDWRVLSARGVALAQQGQYKAAIPFLERARAIAPNQPSVINNLALAYTMDGQAGQAEPMLRQASVSTGADPRVRQNLALVLELQGKKEDADRIAMGGDVTMPTATPASFSSRSMPVVEPVKVAATTPQPSQVAKVTVTQQQPAVARRDLPPPPRTTAARAPAPVMAPVMTPAAPAPVAQAANDTDPDAIIRAAIAAEVGHELERSRNFPTASVPQR